MPNTRRKDCIFTIISTIDLNARDIDGKTSVFYACKNGHNDIVNSQ